MIVRRQMGLLIDESEFGMVLMVARCPPELGIDLAGGQQLGMAAALDNTALVENEYDICMSNGREAVRDDERGAIGR